MLIIEVPYFLNYFVEVVNKFGLDNACVHLLHIVASVGHGLGSLGRRNGAVEALNECFDVARVGEEGEDWGRAVGGESLVVGKGAAPEAFEDWEEG